MQRDLSEKKKTTQEFFLDSIFSMFPQELAAPLSQTTVHLEVGFVGEGDVLGGEEMH